jgi:hypothetical protein
MRDKYDYEHHHYDGLYCRRSAGRPSAAGEPEEPRGVALHPAIPYSKPMEDYVLPDEEKIITAVLEVLGLAPAAR